ncbi:MAG: TauD/TfdA family dioxygenase [Planctomycetaceae bacterium]|nr:TauD/TfdA family dioxygenase [Planctomycetaceae bacterium]
MTTTSPATAFASCVSAISVAGQQTYADSVFPYIYQCRSSTAGVSDAISWIGSQQAELLRLATLHGAVLFRDFPFKSVEDFDSLVAALGVINFPYKKSLSNAVRINRTERVFSANEAPPEVQIFFHHEMAQTPFYPEYILFYCEVAAQQGGATPLCRSDILFQRLEAESPRFIADCEKFGLKYTNVMPGADDQLSGMGRSWQSTLGVQTPEEAEARLRELRYTWEWLEGNCLRATTPVLPAILELPDGRKTFFNQLIAAWSGWKDSRNDPSKSIRHGNEQPLDAAGVQSAIRIADELTFDMNWQAGDAVLIDNRVVMHARRTFVGPRKVVASLGNMCLNSFQERPGV